MSKTFTVQTFFLLSLAINYSHILHTYYHVLLNICVICHIFFCIHMCLDGFVKIVLKKIILYIIILEILCSFHNISLSSFSNLIYESLYVNTCFSNCMSAIKDLFHDI